MIITTTLDNVIDVIRLHVNSIKYSRQNGSFTIIINSTKVYLVVKIRDSRIFQRKNEFTKDISGIGLGLSIVKRIVDS